MEKGKFVPSGLMNVWTKFAAWLGLGEDYPQPWVTPEPPTTGSNNETITPDGSGNETVTPDGSGNETVTPDGSGDPTVTVVPLP